MKRIGNLYQKIISVENLRLADEKARRGKTRTYGVRVHDKNRQDRHGRALDYVGYQFFREQKLIRKSIKKNFCHAVSRLNRRQPPLDAKAYKQAVAPWLGWAKHSNSKHLLKTIIKPSYYGSIL